jgi:hypothetical protein
MNPLPLGGVVPPGAVTVTLTVPDACGGVLNVSTLAFCTVTLADGITVPSTVTDVWPATKPVPLIVTSVLPVLGPAP